MEKKIKKETKVKTTEKKTVAPKRTAKNSDVKKILEKIEKMTVLELNEFVKELQNYFKIDPAALSFSGQGNGAQNQKKTDELEVIVKEVGPSKIALIKLIAKLTGKGLLDAKKMVDILPLSLGKKEEEEAKKLQVEIEEIGAVVELK